MQRSLVAAVRIMCAAAFIALTCISRAQAVPVFANGQGVSCETCHTTFPGMTRYGMMVMMSNFQILNRHLQDRALPISARLYITSLLANKNRPGSTTVSDLSLLAGGFLGRNFTWYTEQHVIDSGVIGQTEQTWLSWNGLLHGTNSIQVGKFHTPFPFMPAHAWTISPYLLASQTTGQNIFNPNDARWGVAFNGMSNEFMYNFSWLTGAGPVQDAFDYNSTRNPRALDLTVSYGGMAIPWSVGVVALRGFAPLTGPLTKAYAGSDTFTREGVYFGYQDSAWHFQTMAFHGFDAHPDIALANVPLNGYFFEAERDLGWRNHLLLRYDVASSNTLNRQFVVDLAHNIEPNLALIGELAGYPGSRPQIALQIAYAGPYQFGKRYLSNLHLVSANAPVATAPVAPTPGTSVQATASASVSSPSSPAPTVGAIAMGEVNAGAKLVQSSGCEGCHGAGLQGGAVGPKLYGIEHRLSTAQIADHISNPTAPMPNFGFAPAQIAQIVAYLSSLDGGSAGTKPVVTFTPISSSMQTTVSVRFPGVPPKNVTATPIMTMGGMSMPTRTVPMHPSLTDPHLFTGKIVFAMGGPWTIRVQYDGQRLDVPLNVGS